jgi:pimeloyl-ACP methyl ester carboxylesterase
LTVRKGKEYLQQYRIEHYVQDVLQTLPHLVQPVTLVGHSMGGLVCQLAAARATLRRLILVASSPTRGMREDDIRMVRRHPYTFLAASFRRSFLRLYRNSRVRRSLLYHAGTPEAVIASAANTLVEESWQAGNQMNTVLPDAAQVHCPVTVFGATEDFMVSPGSIQATALGYNVEPVFLGASGHMIQSEIPASRFAALLHSLLTG